VQHLEAPVDHLHDDVALLALAHDDVARLVHALRSDPPRCRVGSFPHASNVACAIAVDSDVTRW
jgi:hypothetical protein